MTYNGYSPKNHPQQVAKRGLDSEADDHAVQFEDFDVFHARFNFTVDAAASTVNARLPRYYTVNNSGLEASWAGERVWCNPPYSDIRPWVEKAWAEEDAELIVMLLPANRTEQTWWHDLVEPRRDRPGSRLRVEFLPGRLRFLRRGRLKPNVHARPPFGCCLLIWRRGG